MVNIDTVEVPLAAMARVIRAAAPVGAGIGRIHRPAARLRHVEPGFFDTIMGEAVNTAVASISRQLESSAGTVTGHNLMVDGLVADVSGDPIVLNVGSRAGRKVGDRLLVRGNAREISDPALGKVIRRVEDMWDARHHRSGRTVFGRQIHRHDGAESRRSVKRPNKEEPMEFQPGDRLGGYEILGLLGAGGMGKVYQVRNLISQPRGSDEGAASRLTTDRDLVERFLNEIPDFRQPGPSQHCRAPYGATDQGNQLIIIMEFVEGLCHARPTLSCAPREQEIPLGDGLELAQSLTALSVRACARRSTPRHQTAQHHAHASEA